jgi:hypothetical protein
MRPEHNVAPASKTKWRQRVPTHSFEIMQIAYHPFLSFEYLP